MSAGDRVYVVVGKPLPRGEISLVNLYFSTHDYATDAADPVFASIRAVQAVAQPLGYQRRLSILSGGRRAVPSFGGVVLRGDAGDLDAVFTGYRWDDRSIWVYGGTRSQNISDMTLLLQGRVSQCLADLGQVTLAFADSVQRLRIPLQANLYTGAGGANGGAELKGRPKPLLFGTCLNVEPVLVDAANLLYQVHDGPIQAVDAVYVNGAEWTYDPAPVGGEYTYDLAAGTITLGGAAPPGGILTADVQGDDDPDFAATLEAVLARLLDRTVGISGGDIDDIDLGARGFGAYFIETMTVEQGLDRLAQAAGFWWGFTALGKFQARLMGRLKTVSLPVLDEAMILRIACAATPPPVYEVTVGYRRSWRVLNQNEVAGSVSASEHARLTAPAALALARDFDIIHDGARSAGKLALEGWYADAGEAEDVADELLAWFGRELREWTVELREEAAPLAVDLGDTVTVRIARLGLDAGHDFFVDGISRDAASGRLSLTLVG